MTTTVSPIEVNQEIPGGSVTIRVDAHTARVLFATMALDQHNDVVASLKLMFERRSDEWSRLVDLIATEAK
jgi:hypothetical protein